MNWVTINKPTIDALEANLEAARVQLRTLGTALPSEIVDSTEARIARALDDSGLPEIKAGLERGDTDADQLAKLWADWAQGEIELVESLALKLEAGVVPA